jgi:GTPase SAR1 family protein
LPEWLRELKQHINDKVVVVLVGNKSDLVQGREIPYHIGEQFAQRHNMKFIETSAKDSENVEKVFYEIAETLTKQANELYASTKSNGINLNDKNPKTNKIGENICCPN